MRFRFLVPDLVDGSLEMLVEIELFSGVKVRENGISVSLHKRGLDGIGQTRFTRLLILSEYKPVDKNRYAFPCRSGRPLVQVDQFSLHNNPEKTSLL